MLSRIIAFAISLSLLGCGAKFDQIHSDALEMVKSGAVLIDVRSKEEFSEGHLEGALNIPHTQILAGVSALQLDKETNIVLYCRSGNRSGQATTTLANAGFTKVTNAGAYEALVAAQQAK